MSIAYEYEDLNRLIVAHQRHLQALREQQAALGSAAPAYIKTEIREYERKIEELTGQPVEMTVREKHLIDQQFQMRIEGDLYRIDRRVEQLHDLVLKLLEALAVRALTPQKQVPARKRPTVNGGD